MEYSVLERFDAFLRGLLSNWSWGEWVARRQWYRSRLILKFIPRHLILNFILYFGLQVVQDILSFR